MNEEKPIRRIYGYILWRIKNNKNYMQATVGATGSGKSWSCLSQAEILSEMQGKKFTIDQICFSAKELLTLINSGKLKKGDVIIWEEVGVSMDSRSALTITNKVLSYLLQTFRSSGYILLLNLPFFSMLDINARKLMHALFEVVRIDKNNDCIVKPKFLQTNAVSGKTYTPYLRYRNPKLNWQQIRIERLYIPKPSEALIKLYERKKELFNKKLQADILKTIERKEQQEESRNNNTKKELTDKQEGVLNLLKQGRLVPEIAQELGISTKVVYDHIKLIRKKGYIIKQVYENKRIRGYEVDI